MVAYNECPTSTCPEWKIRESKCSPPNRKWSHQGRPGKESMSTLNTNCSCRASDESWLHEDVPLRDTNAKRPVVEIRSIDSEVGLVDRTPEVVVRFQLIRSKDEL